MAQKNFCDRPFCGKEIEGIPYRVALNGQKYQELCKEDQADFESWLKGESRIVRLEIKKE